jgi:hypothetical protein
MFKFITLNAKSISYYINSFDINYITIPDMPNVDIVINCSASNIRIPRIANLEKIIRDEILFWISSTTKDSIIYINPNNVSVIAKHDSYNVKFKNATALECETINGRGVITL